MSRKYEIVNVGGLSRVRALRSWVVQGRQVNAGDVGGAVFDERTLSQDGACWIFNGCLNSPLVRVGGDSVVNIADVNLSGTPFVNIFGTSSLDANAGLSFAIKSLSNASPLTPGKMEQGGWGGSAGQPLIRVASSGQIRSTVQMFTGGGKWTVSAPAQGYIIKVIAADADGIVVHNSGNASAEVTVPAGAHAYAYITVMKSPSSAIVPADVTAAALTFQSYAEATLNIVDSHITVTSPNTGYTYIAASGDYQGNVTNIEGSTLQVNRTSGTPMLNLVCDLINTSATVNMGAGAVSVLGVYKNVKNLVWGAFSWVRPLKSRTIIQATDCDNFVMDGENIPGGTVEAANTPLVFIRCNMNKACIVNQPLINNTYIDINFDLATADLNKLTSGGAQLRSSNVNGMYRLDVGGNSMGALVESYESVKNATVNSPAGYGTTIYADAYLNGSISLSGTNVIGNAVKRPKERTFNAIPVKGSPNTGKIGGIITGVIPNNAESIVVPPYRISGNKLIITIPVGLEAAGTITDGKNLIISNTGWQTGTYDASELVHQGVNFFLRIRKSGGGAINSISEVMGVTVTISNGCKIINTKATPVAIAGNVRVEENAVLKDVSVTGTGYFGGNSVIEAPTALTAPMPIEGAAYMKDKAVFSPDNVAAGAGVSLLDMRDNSVFAGVLSTSATFYNITMANNAEFRGSSSTRSGFVMRGNSFVASRCTLLASCRGLLVMNGNSRVESGDLAAVGNITLTGNYRQTATKAWTGDRVIDSQDAPKYDNNVKTQYDF